MKAEAAAKKKAEAAAKKKADAAAAPPASAAASARSKAKAGAADEEELDPTQYFANRSKCVHLFASFFIGISVGRDFEFEEGLVHVKIRSFMIWIVHAPTIRCEHWSVCRTRKVSYRFVARCLTLRRANIIFSWHAGPVDCRRVLSLSFG